MLSFCFGSEEIFETFDGRSIGKLAQSRSPPISRASALSSAAGGIQSETMALPQSLRTSVTPPELELIASEQLIDIVPLVTMERTAFISVSTLRSNPPLLSEIVRRDNRQPVLPDLTPKGCLRSVTSSSKSSSSVMDSSEPQTEEEMSHRSTRVAISWYRSIVSRFSPSWWLTRGLFSAESLQDRLTRETSNPGFSQLPFRFAEVSKVILDMLVSVFSRYDDETDTG